MPKTPNTKRKILIIGIIVILAGSTLGWRLNWHGQVKAQGSCPAKVPFATYLVTGGGSLWDFGSGGMGSQKCWDLKNYPNSVGQYPSRQRYDYSFFWNHNKSKITAKFTDSTLDTDLVSNRCKDAQDAGKSVICQLAPAGNAVTINNKLSVAANKWVVFFIGDDTNSRPIDLIIDSDVTVNNNGGIIVVVSGNVKVKSTVVQLDGAWLANQKFIEPYDTSISGAANQVQLTGVGYWWSFGGFDLYTFGRSITPNNAAPAELITFDPKYIAKFTGLIGAPAYTWQEVVP